MDKNVKLLKNYILYFLLGLLICFIGMSNVFADFNYIDIGSVISTTELQVDSDMNLSSPITLQPNVTYSLGGVREVRYIVSYNFKANTNYQFETRLNYVEFDNADTYYVTGYNDEECIISYENSLLNDEYPYFSFQCPHNTSSVVIGIYDSTPIPGGGHNTIWSGTFNFMWSKALLRYSPYSLDGNNYDTDKIIDNQTENTQNIINNQNQNTQDIINSNMVCEYIDNKDIITDGYLYNNGAIGTDIPNSGVTDYFKIDDNTIIKKLVSADDDAYYRVCFYNTNKTFISCVTKNEYNSLENISIPSSANYVRFTINKSQNKPQFQICKNGNQALDDSINNLNDSLNDDDSSGASSEASDFFENFTTNTFGLTSIITSPLNLIQSLTSSTCSELHLPLPYLNNKYLDLPCMTTIYQTHFGSFFTMYQTITYGIIAYWVCVRIFNQVKDFKNPEHDEIEVVDL